MISRTFFLLVLVTLAAGQNSAVRAARVATLAPNAVDKTVPSIEPVQRPGFIAVEGATLRSRLDGARRLGRAAATRYWTAYAFDVRPGVSVDLEWNGNGRFSDGTNISFDSKRETRNLGIFFMHDPNNDEPTRVEVYNLERPREYSGYRVYWLGRASNDESLNLLRALVEGPQSNKLNEHATMAIALHDDQRVSGMLKHLVQQ